MKSLIILLVGAALGGVAVGALHGAVAARDVITAIVAADALLIQLWIAMNFNRIRVLTEKTYSNSIASANAIVEGVQWAKTELEAWKKAKASELARQI